MTDPDHQNENELTPNDLVANLERTLASLRGGAMMLELAQALHEVVRAVEATNKPASLSLALKIAPATVTGNAVVMIDDIKVTPPPKDKGQTVLFITEGSLLSRVDTRRPHLVFDDSARGGVVDFPEPKE